jgi:hypothetical protein
MEVPTTVPTSTIIPTPTTSKKLIYIENLSFSAQAPFGDWKDPLQQDGCEEASAIVAVSWAMDKKFTKTEALEMIKKISAYEVENYGQARDTSAFDTHKRIIKGYFEYENSRVEEVLTADQIVSRLSQGNLVIVPANGQELHNPFFTAPGPDRHMLVIRGYDFEKKEFITNEVGTRQGENYRYTKDILFSAIRDYPTGDHLPIINSSKKAILVWK